MIVPIKVLTPALAVLAILSLQTEAVACSRTDEWTTKTIFDESSEVFVAYVTKTELGDAVMDLDGTPQRSLVKVFYELKEVIKGEPTQNGPVATTNWYYGGCGLPVFVGVDYILFITPFPDGFPKESQGNSSGMISFFASRDLGNNPKNLEEAIKQARRLLDQP